MNSMVEHLPLIRSHERMDFKRCQKKWYWAWRRGLVPCNRSFGALSLGTWMHDALEEWYQPGKQRNGSLVAHFDRIADVAILEAMNLGAPDHEVTKANELADLGARMAAAYESHYSTDPGVEVIQAEIPLRFSFSDDDGMVYAVHVLKPDLVYRDVNGSIWLMEHKTAKTISTTHLVIDDQARPYGVMAERALRQAGYLRSDEYVRGIMYNYLRKAIPDTRSMNDNGQYLNKDGTVSKSQPPALFKRHPVVLTRQAKSISLRRIRLEVSLITSTTALLRKNPYAGRLLPKTPHHSCPRCQFFDMCAAEENGTDIRDMERLMYKCQNPYDYGESTDQINTFEMG